jgi:diguanylate cyclase (GGDEF)-like protein/PAS domain S-box-containing protein
MYLKDILHKDQGTIDSRLLKKVFDGETLECVKMVLMSNCHSEIAVQGRMIPQRGNGNVILSAGIFHEITDHGTDEKVLTKSEEKYRLISENTTDLIAILDTRGIHVYVSPSYSLLGYNPNELLSTSGLDLIHPEDKKKLLPLMLRYASLSAKRLFKLKQKRVTEQISFRILDKSGMWHNFESTANLIENPCGSGYNFLLISHDVTRRKQAEDALRLSEERYRELVEKAGIAIAIADNDGKLKYLNGKFAELFGCRCEELMYSSLAALIHPDDAGRVLSNSSPHRGRVAPISAEFRGIKKDGSSFQLEINSVLLKDGERIVGTRLYLWDITERKNTEDELRTISLKDPLTQLYNRRGFYLLVQQQINMANRNMKGFYILFADLDKMKWINDRFGHTTGDEALITAAIVLRVSFRKSDILSRFGGDEFAICAVEANPKSIDTMIIRVQTNFQRLNKEHKKPYRLALSIGAAYYDPSMPCSIDALLKKADDDMFKQKRIKNGTYLDLLSKQAE